MLFKFAIHSIYFKSKDCITMSNTTSTFQTALARFNSNLWSFHIKVSAEIAQPFIDKNRRVLCILESEPAFSCALMPDGEGHFFINMNKARRTKLGLSLGDVVKVTLQKDKSKYGMPMPPIMAELLAQDEEANNYFQKLTPGKQRSLLHMIAKPKTEATRLKKAIVITEYLKTNRGTLDFQELNLAFKEYK